MDAKKGSSDSLTEDRTGAPDYREANGFYGDFDYDRKIFSDRLRQVLSSKPEGEIHPIKILEQLWEKFRIDGNEVATRNGYVFFERLLKSPDFSDVVDWKPIKHAEGLEWTYTFRYKAKSDKSAR